MVQPKEFEVPAAISFYNVRVFVKSFNLINKFPIATVALVLIFTCM